MFCPPRQSLLNNTTKPSVDNTMFPDDVQSSSSGCRPLTPLRGLDLLQFLPGVAVSNMSSSRHHHGTGIMPREVLVDANPVTYLSCVEKSSFVSSSSQLSSHKCCVAPLPPAASVSSSAQSASELALDAGTSHHCVERVGNAGTVLQLKGQSHGQNRLGFDEAAQSSARTCIQTHHRQESPQTRRPPPEPRL